MLLIFSLQTDKAERQSYFRPQYFVFLIIIPYIDSTRYMKHTSQASNALYTHKILFNINRRLKFGQAMYVCGNIPELGNWNPERAFRLKCSQTDRWNAILILTTTPPQNLEFKYIVADWSNPSSSACLWEDGSYNRRLDLRKTTKFTFCEDRWNMDKIIFNLYVPKRSSNQEEQRYYVVGDLEELGAYKEPKIMKKSNSRTPLQKQENLVQALKSSESNNTEIYTFSFYTERNKEQFSYYYIRKTQTMERERKPGRLFNFNAQTASHPQRISVTYTKGEISINDECSLNALKFSRITPKIYVGSYPKSLSDIQRLKEEGVTAIFSIQTERDYKSHGLSPHYFKLMCEECGVKFRRYAIQDMNNEDFVSKAEGGVRVLRELMREERVYVHCSAGIYRSPQMIALYLVLCEQYPLETAIQTIKENHPYAKPSSKVLKQALGSVNTKSVELSAFH